MSVQPSSQWYWLSLSLSGPVSRVLKPLLRTHKGTRPLNKQNIKFQEVKWEDCIEYHIKDEPKVTNIDAMGLDCSFKVQWLCKDFLTQIRGCSNKQTSYIMTCRVHNIYWSISRRDYSKVHSSKLYNVTSLCIVQQTLQGCGTMCWDAVELEAPENIVLIKDFWRSTGHFLEWKLLMETCGIDGVGEMIAYKENCKNIILCFRNYVCKGIYVEKPYSLDCIFSQIVLKPYRWSIKYFENKHQLLYAFCGAIAGMPILFLCNVHVFISSWFCRSQIPVGKTENTASGC